MLLKQALLIENLKKSFGNNEALKGISLSVEPNEIFALIGPNGAGKTTALRIVAALLTPSGGRVEVFGNNVRERPDRVREIISYLPEEAGAYKNLTGNGYLRFMGELFATQRRELDDFLQRARDICGLGDRLNDKIGTYSKGMVRKLLLARALMTRPRLAILDEPTSGLDVINALEVRNLIKGFAREGMSVFLSSHNMLEIEYLSDRVGIIHQGIIYDMGTPEELKGKYGSSNLEEVFAEVAR